MPKVRQAQKIREIGAALEAAGLLTIQEKADALGLSRSSAFALLKADHKNSGLTATLVNAILASPQLPDAVRVRLLEYVDEKISGRYGHNATQLRRFISRLALVQHVADSKRLATAVANRRSNITTLNPLHSSTGKRWSAPVQSPSGTSPKFRRVS